MTTDRKETEPSQPKFDIEIPTHHLLLTPDDVRGNDGMGRYFMIPGSPGRAKLIAGLFDTIEKEIITPRHNDTYLGRVYCEELDRNIDVAATSSGMGTGSTEIITVELIACGAKRLVRVGTSGSVQYKRVKVGDYVIATGAVRDELTSQHYACQGFPALADTDIVVAYERAARKRDIADRTFRGIVHTKASLYARAIFLGGFEEEHLAFKQHMIDTGVVASEMEASTLFTVASTLAPEAVPIAVERSASNPKIKAGTVLGIIGGKDEWATPDEVKEIERRTCAFAIEGLKQLAIIDERGI